MSSGIFEAYAAGEAGAFFDGHFARAEDRRRARAVVRPIAPALADALEAQNARHVRSVARDAHLVALRRGAAAVVTGQQVGFLLGPLYTLYKAATAVRLARALALEWGVPVVPVFWLQSEDHDLAEIAACHVASPNDEPFTLQLEAPAGSVSVSQRVLPDAVAARLHELGVALGSLPHAQEHLALLARHYRPGAGWSAAFAGVIAELFAEEGLVSIDPCDPALALLAAPVHRRAILSAPSIARGLRERGQALEAAGVSPTVHVRDGAPLSFFHPGGPEGPRYRLDATPLGFVEVGGAGVHSEATLLDVLDDRPGSFTTSALLRPILQDTWLPTAVYVGGPAEVAYFAQMPPVYSAFGLQAPLVAPRARLRLLEDKQRRILARRDLTAGDVCRPFDEVLRRARGEVEDELRGDAASARLLEPFEATLAKLSPALRAAGPGIDRALERTRASVTRAVGKLARRYDKARLYRDQALVTDVRRLQTWLHPDDHPQERHYGMSYFAARYGQRPFLERVLSAATPFEVAVKDLDL